MPIRAVFFDMDGTLTDTRRPIPFLIRHYLNKKKEVTFEETMAVLALIYNENTSWFNLRLPTSLSRTFRISTLRVVVGMLIAVWKYLQWDSNPRIFPETNSILQELRDHRLKIALITNGSLRQVKSRIPSLIPYFDLIIHNAMYKRKKPSPEPLLRGLRALKVSSQEAVYVGDALEDFLAALAAGMQMFLVPTGTFGPGPVYSGEFRPTLLKRGLRDLPEFVLS
ncbi:MAG: HAD family hydrolase [Promethearchaeota archaeon]